LKENNSEATPNINIEMESPKLIIDEYLLAERVIEHKKPFFFMIDLGTWKFKMGTASRASTKLRELC